MRSIFVSFSLSSSVIIILLSIITNFILYKIKIFNRNLRHMFYLNHNCFILTAMLTFARDLCLVTFYTQRTFEYLYYASFAMLSACSFATSLHCIERILAYYKLISNYLATISITAITQLLGNYYRILNSISSSLLFLTIQTITFVIFLYTVYKTNIYYRMKTSERSISLPLSYKYQLQQIYKSSKLLTLIIFCVVFSNVEGCCHTLIMYLISDEAINLIDHALTFQFVINLCIIFRLLILIFLQKKFRAFVNDKLSINSKSAKVEPLENGPIFLSQTKDYFNFYAKQW